MPRSIHTKKFDDCVRDVKRKGSAYNPYAVCMSALGEKRAVKKVHRRKNPETEIRELELYAENNEELYRQRIIPILNNLARKIKRGVYDPEKALVLWKYAADDAAKRYGKELGNNDGFKIFSPADRRAVAKELQMYYQEELENLVEKIIERNPATGFLLAVKNTASGQRAYYTGEEPEAFDSNKMRGKVYASAAHAQAAMRMLLRDKTLKRGWKYAVVPATFTNPASGERLYTDFHGEPPRRIKTRQLPTFRRGLEIGPVVALTYDTKRDGKITRYEHEFDDRAAPLLIASDSGHELALTGGSYQFTDRGIQDRVGKLK